jgi:mono/diheme cytochrome c family protein
MRSLLVAPLLLLVTLASAGPAAAAGEGIEVWTRADGNHSLGKKPTPLGRKTVVLKDMKQSVRTMTDSQVGGERTYKGVSLDHLLRRSGRRTGDLLLLRFVNGMIVQVPRAELKALDLFVATAVKDEEGQWTSTFPAVKKSDDITVDPRPVTFQANKVVAPSPRLPGLLDPSGADFSPWKYVDTLIAIEVVDQAAWEAQFIAPRPAKKDIAALVGRGQEVYLKACQYCHGVRDVGATYGWDFLVPLPMHSLKKPRDLYEHVTMAPFDKVEDGLMMPEQNLTKRDVAAVWAWNKMLGKNEQLGDYRTDPFSK